MRNPGPKLHLLKDLSCRPGGFPRVYVSMACGKKIEAVINYTVDYTNDASTMEALPVTKTCKSCMRAIRAANAKGDSDGQRKK